MHSEAVQIDDPLAVSYLQHLQVLAAEIHVAMDAITKNAIVPLQESVAKQEMLCALLANLANTIAQRANSSGQPQLRNDSSTAREIRVTSVAIRDLNLQYAALLNHSGRSLALLVSLCKSHTGQPQEAGGSRSKRQTWSCEV